jgi:hypothetical protein
MRSKVGMKPFAMSLAQRFYDSSRPQYRYPAPPVIIGQSLTANMGAECSGLDGTYMTDGFGGHHAFDFNGATSGSGCPTNTPFAAIDGSGYSVVFGNGLQAGMQPYSIYDLSGNKATSPVVGGPTAPM